MFENILGTGIPEGYRRDYNFNSDKERYVREGKGELRFASSEDIKKLNLPSILGDNPVFYEPKDSDEKPGDVERFGGYFPLFGFYSGGKDMWTAISTLYDRVIVQNNKVTDETKEQKGKITLVDRTVVKVNLSAVQKASLVARCAMVWVRGLITFCQIGVVFAPFDAVANWWYKEPSK